MNDVIAAAGPDKQFAQQCSWWAEHSHGYGVPARQS